MTKAHLETLLPKAFFKLHECLAHILKKNKVIDVRQVEKDKKILSIFQGSFRKILQTLDGDEKESSTFKQVEAFLLECMETQMESEIRETIGNIGSMISSF
jgi:hypothetical protein